MQLRRILTCLAAAVLITPLGRADAPMPKLDPKRIINESYSFLKDQEPEMAADEYALYEKTVSLISVQPAFALKLLETMVGGDEKKSPAFLLALGNVYFTNGKPDLAEKYFRQALAEYPSFQRAWSNLGALLYSQGRYQEAVPCFAKVVANGKADAGTLGVLAYCQMRAGKPLAAEMNYIQALGLDPDNPDWLGGLLSLSLEAKQYGRAEQLLKQLIRLKPQEKTNWVLYANVLNSEGRPLEAIAWLEAARALGYVDNDGLLLLGDLYTDQKLSREAVAAYRQVMAQSPDIGAKRLIRFAQALITFNQLPEAQKTLDAVTPDVPPETRLALLQTRAELAVAQQQWPEAEKRLNAVLQLQPLDGSALLSLGRVYKAQKNTAGADLVLEQAARIPATSYRATLEIADLALATHRYARGLEYLEKALAIERSPALQQYIAKIKLIVPPDENAAPNS